jgi:uncharacterized membrane protein
MEFLLLVGCGVLLFMVLKRVNAAHDQTQSYQRTLSDIGDRLDELTRRIAILTPGAGPVPATATPTDTPPPHPDDPTSAAQPARTSTENVRVWDYSTPVPKLGEPWPGAASEPPKAIERPAEPAPEPIPPSASEPVQPQPGADAPPPGDAPPADTAPPPSGGPNFGDFEKRFGTQWVVWVGGLALALGGIFLVRYSIEAGLFGPGLRIIFGAILALVLVGLGELARRREIISGLDKIPTGAHIPSILTAAGTTCAYADIWAAHALYNFLSPAAAFVLLGLVALGTLTAALRHGPALGGLGLVGAYVTPLLVGSQEPSYWALYVYLTVVTAAAYALARIRMWRWLAITAAVASILWMFVGMDDPSHGSLSAHAFYAAAGFALAAYFIVAGLFAGPPAEPGRIDPVSCGVLAGYLFGAFLLAIATAHAPLAVATLFALMAATVAIAWRSEAALLAVPVAAILAVLLVGHWVLNWWFVQVIPRGPWSSALDIKLTGIGLHVMFAAATAALFGGAGYLMQGRSEQPAFSMLWATIAVATAVIMLILVYYRVIQFDRSFAFAGLALLLAAACAFATEQLWKREPRPGTSEAGAIFATGAVAGLALTLTFALEKGWLTVALSLMVPGIAWIADRRPLPMLRKLCALLAVLVLARVFWDPRIVGNNIGTTPIFNWLLWGYGVPAVSFWIAGRILRRQGDDLPSRSVESAAITFAALTAFLEIRHLMNDGDIYRPGVRLGELGLQVSTALAMVIGMEHVRARVNSIVHDWGARIFGALAFLGILALLFIENPMVTGRPVGGMFLNYVLLGYGTPAVLLGILARTIKTGRPQPYYIGAAVTSIVMMLVYLTLEVRTLFQGSILKGGIMSDAEDYTYSAVWLSFGVLLLVVGIVLKSQPARLASAAVVILTIGKVFLHDLAGVQGIFRALSFIGLGLVLIGIGWLYQRLLFPRQPTNAEAGSAPAS